MKRVIIIGGGDSVTEGLSKDLWTKIKGNTIWSLNYAFMTMPYLPTREIWVDRSFFKHNIDVLSDLANKNVEMIGMIMEGLTQLPKAKLYKAVRKQEEYNGKEGIIKNKIYRGSQGFVGTYAIHLAICEGYNEIFLLGFDYGVPPSENPSTQTHFYQGKIKVQSDGVGRPEVYLTRTNKVNPKVSDYQVFLQEKDIKIWNVSPLSNISCFEKLTYDDFFTKIGVKNEI